MRVFYGLAGCVLLGTPFLFGITGSVRWIMLAVGVLAVLEGAVGW